MTTPEYSRNSKSSLEWDCAVNMWATENVCSRRKLASFFKGQELDIIVHHHFTSKHYTSGSPISGDVIISPRKDVPFDDVQISLKGMSRVRRQEGELGFRASHVFLDIPMPVDDSAFPPSRVFKGGETYKIPFHFVMPHCLPSAACTHDVESEHIRHQHLRMPPTMGSWEKDDMSPKMAKIEYSIRASVLKSTNSGFEPRAMLAGFKMINFLPLSLEDPPLEIPKTESSYTLSKSKPLRQSILSPAIGRISVFASQPRALLLSNGVETGQQTTLSIQLAFKPMMQSTNPPESIAVAATLVSETWHYGKPIQRLPDLCFGREAYWENVSLLPKSDVKADWSKEGRDTVSLFTSDLTVPLQFPSSKHILLPTFHSCLVSRTYKIRLALKIGTTRLKLAVPLQVASERIDQDATQATEAQVYNTVKGSGDSSVGGIARPCSMDNFDDLGPLPAYSLEG